MINTSANSSMSKEVAQKASFSVQTMNSVAQSFNFEGNAVRVVIDTDGDSFWVLSDVCKALELSNPSVVAARLDDDQRSKFNLGRQGNATVVNESGLYDVILDSRKPQARKFRKWVVGDVLPSIRKHGAYATPQTIETIISNPDFGIKLLNALKNERAQRAKAEKQLEAQKPKVVFADAVSASERTILVGELAKILHQNGVPNMGQNRLFAWLRSHGYLTVRNGFRNMPTQKAMELGLFEIKESAIACADGHTKVSYTTKVTPRGQVYFINKFMSDRKQASLS